MGLALAILVFAGALPALAQDCQGLMVRVTEEEQEAFSREHERLMAKINKAVEAADGDDNKLIEELDKTNLSVAEAEANYKNSKRAADEAQWNIEEDILESINPFVYENIPQERIKSYETRNLVTYWKNITPEQVQTCLNDEANTNIDVQSKYGRTPLHNAARFSKNPEVIMTLLKAGADVTLKDRNGNTAFDWAGYNEALKGTDAYQALKDAQN